MIILLFEMKITLKRKIGLKTLIYSGFHIVSSQDIKHTLDMVR